MMVRRYEIKDSYKMGHDFSHIFGVSIDGFVDKELSLYVYGYWVIDLSKFEDFIDPDDDESIENAIELKYGKHARHIIECLI